MCKIDFDQKNIWQNTMRPTFRFRFRCVKINKSFLDLVDNRLKIIFKITYQFDFIKYIRLTINTRVNSCVIGIVTVSGTDDIREVVDKKGSVEEPALMQNRI